MVTTAITAMLMLDLTPITCKLFAYPVKAEALASVTFTLGNWFYMTLYHNHISWQYGVIVVAGLAPTMHRISD
jgi:hypothetical protein